jgi:hypothetical protein
MPAYQHQENIGEQGSGPHSDRNCNFLSMNEELLKKGQQTGQYDANI